MYVLTIEQMRLAEAAADAMGQSYALMMESAGQAVAMAVRQLNQPEGLQVLVLVGPGHNGGDGLVAAYHLHRMGAEVACYLWRREVSADENFDRAQEAGVRLLWAKEDLDGLVLERECRHADVIVDALLGTGATRPIADDLAELLGQVRAVVDTRRQHRLPWIKEALQIIDPTLKLPERPETPAIVAVDVPSGLHCDSGAIDPAALPADITVTFGFPKRGQFLFPGASKMGKLLIAEIGIPPRLVQNGHLQLVTSRMVAERLPLRPLDAHKGTFGRALVVSGSVNYTGAPALAAMAALRVGAGLVTLALPECIFPIVASKLLEPTFILLPHAFGGINVEAARLLTEKAPEYQALLIGPGLGQEKEVARFILEFLQERGRPKGRARLGFTIDEPIAEDDEQTDVPLVGQTPLVIDADALNILAGQHEWWKRLPAGCVLTPHPGEMARLASRERDEIQTDRIECARQAAQEWGQIVVLKGAHTVIAAPNGDVYLLPFANPTLATAGTGDVLAGMLVGFLAQGLAPLDAAIVSTFLHGVAAEELEFSRNQSCGTVASDLLAFLPAAIQRLRA